MWELRKEGLIINNWEERSEETREYLKQLEEWVREIGWHSLPKGVRKIIICGQIECEKQLERYEYQAEQEVDD